MKNKKIVIILLLILICFHLVANILWHNYNQMLFGKATFEQFNKTVNMLRIFNNEVKPYFFKYDHSKLYNIIFTSYNFPPLYYLSVVLLYKIFFFIFAYKAIYSASTLFFILLIVFTYLIGRTLYDPAVGLFAAVICSFTPFIFFVSRQLNLEMAVTTFTVLSFYFIIKSEYMLQRKAAICAGFFAGISLLFKCTALIFIFSYLIWFFIGYIVFNHRENPAFRKKREENFSLFFCLLILIAAIYYVHPAAMHSFLQRAVNLNLCPGFISRIDCYIKGLFRDALGMVLGVIGVIASFAALRERKIRNILIYWIIIPLCSIVIFPKNIPDEQLEFLLPLLPAVAIIVAAMILSLKNILYRICAVVFLTIFLIVQFFLCSFTPQIKINGEIRTRYDSELYLFGYGQAPQKGGAFEKIIKVLSERNNDKKLQIGTIYTGMNIFPAIFGSLVYLEQKDWQITFFSLDKNDFFKKINEFDYIIYSSSRIFDVLAKDKRLAGEKDNYSYRKIFLFESDTYLSTFKEFIFLLKNKR